MDILTLAKRAHGCCLNCGFQPADHNDLEPHHITTRGAGGKDTLENIAPLCHTCHTAIGQEFLVPGKATTVPDDGVLWGDDADEFLRKKVRDGLARNPARRQRQA